MKLTFLLFRFLSFSILFFGFDCIWEIGFLLLEQYAANLMNVDDGRALAGQYFSSSLDGLDSAILSPFAKQVLFSFIPSFIFSLFRSVLLFLVFASFSRFGFFF